MHALQERYMDEKGTEGGPRLFRRRLAFVIENSHRYVTQFYSFYKGADKYVWYAFLHNSVHTHYSR